MVKIALILAGCGHLDGAEIRESVITMMALDKEGADCHLFAPDIDQMHIINHLTGEEMPGKRNVLVEAARIARGDIKPLSQAKADDFDALILPGGFGAAKNLSDLAVKGASTEIIPEYKNLVCDFFRQEKPIGAICISPAILVAALKDVTSPLVTIGDDEDGLIESLGGKHQPCQTKGIVIDATNHIVSCSAYMREDSLTDIRAGIEKLVEVVINNVKSA